MFPESGVLEVLVIPLTGYPLFDWFFTLIVVFGLCTWVVGAICHLMTRS